MKQINIIRCLTKEFIERRRILHNAIKTYIETKCEPKITLSYIERKVHK